MRRLLHCGFGDIVRPCENHGKKEDACATCEAPVEEQPAPAEEAPVATVADDDDRTSYVPVEGDDAIVFSAASKNETIDDRYAELSDEAKSYFDEIVKYALSKSDEVKRVKNARYEEYKIRRTSCKVAYQAWRCRVRIRAYQ